MTWKMIIETGFASGLIVNALLFIPQALKLFREKRSNELSFITFFGFNIIQLFIILHAYLANDIILFIGTSMAFITCGLVSFLILFYRYRRIPN